MRPILPGRRIDPPSRASAASTAIGAAAPEAGVNITGPVAGGQVAGENTSCILSIRALIARLRSTGSSRREAVFTQLSSIQAANTAYFAQLEAWVQAGGASGGNRAEAANRIKVWVDQNQAHAPLHLSNLNLTSLPATLPSTLHTLDVSENQLTSLPTRLPSTLHTLDVSDNQLTSLPARLPSTLHTLKVYDNQLTSLPATLPSTLHTLSVSGNQLTSLPARLPSNLRYFAVTRNQLTSLPEELLSLPNTCNIQMNAHHLSEAVRNRLSAAMNRPGYNNVRIFFDLATPAARAQAYSLEEEVSAWTQEGGLTTPLDWSAVQSTPHASQFAQFLGRLRETSQYKDIRTRPDFQQRVVSLLSQIEHDPELRNTCFNLAQDAVDTCGDRVALGMLNMEALCLDKRMDADIKAGKFDNNPQVVVEYVKAQYRQQALTEAASAKIKTLNFVDEIEVVLGFTVAFGGEFKLNAQMDTMLFGRCSAITPEDVYEVRKSLTNRAFTHDTKAFYEPFFGGSAQGGPTQATQLGALADHQKSASEEAQFARSFQQFMLSAPSMTALLNKKYPADMTPIEQDCVLTIEAGKAAINEQLEQLDLAHPEYGQQCKDLQERYNNVAQEVRAEARSGLLARLCEECRFDARDI